MVRIIKSFCAITTLSVLLGGCATTGGFEPAQTAIKSFNDGAKLGKAYVDARSSKLLDAERLSLLAWHSTYVSDEVAIFKNGQKQVPLSEEAIQDYRSFGEQKTHQTLDSFNKKRLLQPGDKVTVLSSEAFSNIKKSNTPFNDIVSVEHLALYFVCNSPDVDTGALLMSDAQTVAKSLSKFNYEASDKSLDNLQVLLSTPKANKITLSSTDGKERTESQIEADIKKGIKKNTSRCISDFERSKQAFLSENIKGSGQAEGFVAVGVAAYSSIKELDKAVSAILSTIASYKRRSEFNNFVKDNKAQLTTLKEALEVYAKDVNELDLDKVRLAAMTDYIFTFETFAKAMVDRKPQSNRSMFLVQAENLDKNTKALNVIKSANAYKTAKNSDPATAVVALAKSVEGITALTDNPSPEDLYAQYNAGKEFFDSLSDLAEATQDDDLKKSLKDIKALF